MTLSLQDLIATCQTRTEKLFTHYLRTLPTPSPALQQAMAYAVFNGGKRVRPLLVYATGYALDANFENADAAACAIEIIHSYSLIHDDLPAMDNADLRRGKPSCHKAFGEAMAILAGDALQTLAIQILATHPTELSPQQRLAMIAVLSEASGPDGMAGGQALDITPMDKTIAADKLMQLYELKTGALLTASVKLGILCAPSPDKQTQTSLEKYAECMGLAFQIQDDLLDMESNTTTLGKPQGLDTVNNKMTYPLLFGLDKTRQKIQELTDLSLNSIELLGEKAGALRELALHLLHRKQ